MALLGGVLLFLKKKMPGVSGMTKAPRALEVVERVTLGPHHALHLVRVGERRVLVATAPSSCQVIES